jgi:hypothetical protein
MDSQIKGQRLADEVLLLSRLHITYGLMNEPCFADQKQKIADMIASDGINVKQDLDPLTLNLYRRYFE